MTKTFSKWLVVVGLMAGSLTVPSIARADISDADLGEKVVDSIQKYSKFSMFDDISIRVENRVVTLMGCVTAPIKRDEIEKRVAKIDGVKSLINEIRVLPLSPYDGDLRVQIARAIYSHPAFWQYASMAVPPIHIVVDGGHVTLTGRVGSQMDRSLAYSLAQVPGAFSVTNQLKVDR